MENNPSTICSGHDENSNSSLRQANIEVVYVESMDPSGKVTECQTVMDAEENKTMVTRKEKSDALNR